MTTALKSGNSHPAEAFPTLESEISDFLDTSKEVPGREQLYFMEYVLGEFDHVLPGLSRDQRKAISRNAELNPTRRLIPAPLGDFGFRKEFLKPAPDSAAEPLMAEHLKQEIWTPVDSHLPADNEGKRWPNHDWADLWRGVARVVCTNKYSLTDQDRREGIEPELKTYGLRYKTPDGKLWARGGFLKSLLEAGDAVRGADGKLVWTFPYMDVQNVEPNRNYTAPEPIFRELSHVVTPEALLTVQALHVLAGRPMHPDVTHVANEAVYEVKPDARIRSIYGVSGVTRNVTMGFLRQGWWTMKAMPDWHPANGASGLS